MIQRIQTLLLLLAAIMNIGVLFLPLWVIADPQTGTDYIFSGMKIENSNHSFSASASENVWLMILLALVLLASGATLFGIFGYQDRRAQIKRTYFSRAMLVGEMTFIIYLAVKILPEIAHSTEQLPGTFGYGFFLPIICIALVWLAATRIRKDEELVRGMDRFR